MFKKLGSIILVCAVLFTNCGTEEEVIRGEASVYDSTSKWQNQDGEEVSLDIFKGKTQVIAMMFTSCPMVCPRMVADMVVLDEKIEQKDKVNYILLWLKEFIILPHQNIKQNMLNHY